MAAVRAYLAQSLDGFVAGPGDDLSWLPQPAEGDAVPASPDAGLGFSDFLSEVGALLMGRRTFDVVQGFGGPWPYGALPVLVATHRPLPPAPPQVRPVAGPISDLVDAARAAAGDRDVYLDGPHLIRQALDAGLVDELILTVVPILLGAGVPLFSGIARRHTLRFTAHQGIAPGMVQLRAQVLPGPTP